jgi:hypothetical protein
MYVVLPLTGMVAIIKRNTHMEDKEKVGLTCYIDHMVDLERKK